MVKLLVKKELAEVFKGYFYNAKKNKARSKAGVIGFFIFFVLVIVGLLGGIFTYLSMSLCGGLVEAGMGWLYFALMGGMAILLGAFGSVFNTFHGLYLSKDNDLLLSMPIPVKDIIAARLINVYLMGAMYSLIVIIPAVVVYWIEADMSFMNGLDIGFSEIACGIILIFIVTAIVLVLSCLLGWVVAKISLKLKNRSFVTVIASLIFIGLYYFVYFKANDLIQDLLLNAAAYGEKIKGAAYWVYSFGRIGEGDWTSTVFYLVLVIALMVIAWIVLSRSFLKIATSSGERAKVKKDVTKVQIKEKSVFGALLSKEFGRFTSSSNYMLNTGLGILFLPAVGIGMIIKGGAAVSLVGEIFEDSFGKGLAGIIFAAALILLTSMNDMVAPSVSLEGKNIWIPQSLPVEPKMVLRAKACVHLILTEIPMLIAVVCTAIVLRGSAIDSILFILLPLVFVAFWTMFGSFIGIKLANLMWTNEVMPIKQGGASNISVFGGWAVALVFVVPYFLVGYHLGANVYLAIWIAVFLAGGLILLRWLDTKGAQAFAEL